ncbi:hypothetical protein [Streptomyces sp. CBG9]|uniref:RipA family octameric membrane protein n=1 Tax=Streptomyces sp. CBG9 TaxID=2762622 RepID=UPI001C963E57|nr:hypothetical protein [Streptomyces sp. CBG9]
MSDAGGPENQPADDAEEPTGSAPGDRDRADLLELHRLAVDMADRVSARRATANSFFLSLQSALVAFVGLSGAERSDQPWWAATTLATTGVTLSVAWLVLLLSYRDLNAAKFRVILALEERLPARIFHDEWAALTSPSRPRSRRYVELGTAERLVPAVFGCAHALLLVGTLWL